MRYRVLPYKQGSKSAKALATALGGRVLRLEGSTFRPRAGDLIINWGRPENELDLIYPCAVANGCEVRRGSNKLLFFRTMRDAGFADIIPPFWENINEIPNDSYPVVVRTVLAGHSGDGIVIANNAAELVPASLYVQYMKKKEEFRVHVGAGTQAPITIAVQRKARRLDHENPNWQVRNHANGFIYAREGFTTPQAVLDVAHAALLASGLDFGAVDVIWNAAEEKAYVLEINTAPGLEGQTVTDYARFFKGELA